MFLVLKYRVHHKYLSIRISLNSLLKVFHKNRGKLYLARFKYAFPKVLLKKGLML